VERKALLGKSPNMELFYKYDIEALNIISYLIAAICFIIAGAGVLY